MSSCLVVAQYLYPIVGYSTMHTAFLLTSQPGNWVRGCGNAEGCIFIIIAMNWWSVVITNPDVLCNVIVEKKMNLCDVGMDSTSVSYHDVYL